MKDREFTRTLEQAALPGVSALILDREGIRYSHVSGHADATTGRAMQLDTPCQIASMTKAIVSVGAMQLVEGGMLELDAPIGTVLPTLARPHVLTGFDQDGTPQLRPAVRPITLRHLLTHTAGFGYFFVHPEILAYFAHVGVPPVGSRKGVEMPLLFDPGERWEYGVATDWVGFAIEAVTGQKLGEYLAEHVFGPLGMRDSGFPGGLPARAARVHQRQADGGFAIAPMDLSAAEFQSGGGGLVSTAPDYARFLRAFLRGGELDGRRILSARSVAEMSSNQIGDLRAGHMGTSMPDLFQPVDGFPDQQTRWGLGFLINPERGPNGRSPGSLAWAGIFNSFYWIDPAAGCGGILMTQLTPFGDPGAAETFAALERLAYS